MLKTLTGTVNGVLQDSTAIPVTIVIGMGVLVLLFSFRTLTHGKGS